MANRTTINVDKENHQKANQVKEIHSESWPEVLEFYWKHRGNGYMYDKDERLLEAVREVNAFDTPDQEEVADAFLGGSPEEVREQLDRIERAASTVEERTGRIERTLEDMGAGR